MLKEIKPESSLADLFLNRREIKKGMVKRVVSGYNYHFMFRRFLDYLEQHL